MATTAATITSSSSPVTRTNRTTSWGFVEGCLERIAEEEDEDLTHPDDVTAEQLRDMWLDPGMPPEEKREMVLESLKAECEVREDEGNLWRL